MNSSIHVHVANIRKLHQQTVVGSLVQRFFMKVFQEKKACLLLTTLEKA